MSQIRCRMAETTNYEQCTTRYEIRNTRYAIRNTSICPLQLSRALYKSPTFYAKQTQFPRGQNERKLNFNNELYKYYPAGGAKKQTQFKPNFQDAKMYKK